MIRREDQLRVVGTLALAATLIAFGLVALVRRVNAEIPTTGIEWIDSASGPLAISVTTGGAGWEAGLRPGDLLLELDGAPAPGARQTASLIWDVDAADGIRLTVGRGVERHEVVLHPRRTSRSEPYGYLAVVGLAFFVSGGFIALRWPSVRGGREYGWFAACMFVHLVFSHTGRADALDWVVYWMDVIAGAFAPALLLHFVFALSRRVVPAKRGALLLAYAPALALVAAAVVMSPGAVGAAERLGDPLAAEELRERAEPLFLSVAVVLSIFVLSRSYQRSSSTLQRSQLRWLLWGLIVGLTPFVVFYAVPFAIGAPDPSWAAFVSVLPMLFVPGAFTAALARFRLFDLSLLLRRALSEVTTVFATFAVYAVARETGSGLLGLSDSGSRYLAILVAVIAYPQLRTWVRVGVDRAFYRERYSYRATLLDWARELSTETDLAKLLDRLRRRVCETLALDDAHAMIRTGESRFDLLADTDEATTVELPPTLVQRLEDEPSVATEPGEIPDLPWVRWLFAMKVENELRAVLVTADRAAPDEPLSTEDRALLATLSAHAATAIEAARLLREVRRRAEEIEHLNARQERILESSAVGLLLTDADGAILALNRALEEIYALERDEALGKRLSDVFPLHLVRRVEQELERVPPGDQARIYRHNLINRKGERRIVNLAVTSTVASGGGSGNQVITFDDVSEQVKLEEQVLQQERLASLGMLAAGVAHEVNTPLTGISSYTQFLLEELPAGDPRRETLGKIEAQTRRASNIVNSLLNMSRADQAAFETLQLNDVIREVVELFEPQIRRREVELALDLAPALPEVQGHRGKIQQVLLNLLINAGDAVGASGAIRLSTAAEANRVVVQVADDGTGIAEEDLQRIFDPFFTTKGRGKGTGLGLSISYGIVQEHAGEVHVESTPGEGTRFRIELPAASSAEAMA